MRSALRWLLMLSMIAAGLWLVVVNRQPIDLNLLFWSGRAINSGLALLLAFALGSLLGIFIGLDLYQSMKLKGRVLLLRRELAQLRQHLGGR